MCFYTPDSDWFPEYTEESLPVATAPVRCDECLRTIVPGETYFHMYCREHECCRECGNEGSEDAPPCDGVHDYGETMRYDCCRECARIRDLLERIERDRGCSEEESSPPLTDLREIFRDHPDADAYRKIIARECPSLRAHLDRLRCARALAVAVGPDDPWRDLGGES